MAEKLVKIVDPIGLHARPASILVTIVSKYTENKIVMVLDDGKIVNAKSIMNILSCSIEVDQEFKIRVEGNNSKVILEELIQSLSNQEILQEV